MPFAYGRDGEGPMLPHWLGRVPGDDTEATVAADGARRCTAAITAQGVVPIAPGPSSRQTERGGPVRPRSARSSDPRRGMPRDAGPRAIRHRGPAHLGPPDRVPRPQPDRRQEALRESRRREGRHPGPRPTDRRTPHPRRPRTASMRSEPPAAPGWRRRLMGGGRHARRRGRHRCRRGSVRMSDLGRCRHRAIPLAGRPAARCPHRRRMPTPRRAALMSLAAVVVLPASASAAPEGTRTRASAELVREEGTPPGP